MPKPIPKDKARARVAVAKDVIKRIQAKKLRTRTGNYIRPHSTGALSSPDEVESRCAVCAIGAAAISYVRLFNRFELPVDRHWGAGRPGLADILSTIFSFDELDQIESAFECQARNQGWLVSQIERKYELLAPFVEFGCRFGDPADRLLAIMQNIVDGNGTFDPTVEYEIVQE